jgi:hypothetical protein
VLLALPVAAVLVVVLRHAHGWYVDSDLYDDPEPGPAAGPGAGRAPAPEHPVPAPVPETDPPGAGSP